MNKGPEQREYKKQSSADEQNRDDEHVEGTRDD
jgi:hypothetical protein